MLFPSLQTKLARYEELEKLLVDPDVLSDTNRMGAFQREYGSLAKGALPVREFIEKRLGLMAIIVCVLLLGGFIVAKYAI